MLVALPVGARRKVYREVARDGDAAEALESAWIRQGVPDFNADPDSDVDSDPAYYTKALAESTRADVRAVVVALLRDSSPSPEPPKNPA